MKILKQTLVIAFVFVLLPTFNSEAQVRIGGQIDIDIRVDLPEIIVKPNPRRSPNPRPKRPVVIKERLPESRPCHCEIESYGEIINQNNGPRFDYNVIDSAINFFENNELDLIFSLNTGDTMVISMVEYVLNDYNFHYFNNPNGYNNTILRVSVNGIEVPMNSASVSLQPIVNGGYTAVLNLHSQFDGDFNGTINM